MMKLTIVHDDKGNILELVAYPADAPPAYPQVSAGLVTQVEEPDLTMELGEKGIFQHLANLRENFRVEVGTRAKLMAK